jgi:hypothetical protein
LCADDVVGTLENAIGEVRFDATSPDALQDSKQRATCGVMCSGPPRRWRAYRQREQGVEALVEIDTQVKKVLAVAGIGSHGEARVRRDNRVEAVGQSIQVHGTFLAGDRPEY